MENVTPLKIDESMLMLYLADELSTQQKRAIDQRLGTDPTLAAALERLREVDAWLSTSFDELDRSQALPGTPASWQRRIGRLIRQWQVRKALATPAIAPGRQIGSWAYTAAAAVLVIVGYTAYWGFENDARPVLTNNDPYVQNVLPVPASSELAADPLPDVDHQQDLASAEKELGDLAELRTSFQ